jgi:hypothetical protein
MDADYSVDGIDTIDLGVDLNRRFWYKLIWMQ